jgi:SpoVK/Ycf46/Vps4 family AAA+-type ATPase
MTQNFSPTRVSGIFKRKNGINSPINEKSDNNKRCDNSVDVNEVVRKRPIFMTGLEKKVVDDVKKGLNVNEAKKFLSNVRQQQPFRNPIKSETDKRRQENEYKDDERLKNISPVMIETIESQIISKLEPIEWSKIAGLQFAKAKIKEIAILPLLRPDLFTGLRVPPKGSHYLSLNLLNS